MSATSGAVLTGVPMPWRVVVPNVASVAAAAWFLARLRRRRVVRESPGALAAA